MMRRLALGAAVCAGLGFAGAPAARSSVLTDVRLVTLDNGMRVLMAPDSLAASVDLGLWYDASPRLDPPGLEGMAHLFEHLMFDGTTRVAAGEFRRRIEATGGSADAYTTPDLNCFHSTMPPDELAGAIRMEADRMSALALTQAKLDSEKARTRLERRERETHPFMRGIDRLYATAFTRQHYRRTIFGTEASLGRITLANAREFYRSRYAPSGALMTVVGRFDPDSAEALARRHFGAAATARPAAVAPVSEPAATGARHAVEPGELRFPVMLMGWRGPGSSSDETPLMAMLSIVLANGPASRLNGLPIGVAGPALFARGGHEPHRDASLFYAMVGAPPGADSAAVEDGLLAQVRRLVSEPIAADELERARRQVELALLLDAETPRGRARMLGTAQMLEGDARQVERHLQRIRSATADDLVQVAARHLDPERRTVVWMPAGAAGQP
jgi:predicted Zn-dependent peptidase